mmetsp:Transcript_27444/g.87288  ORF Transcript_27444/g.87288 Transcript_27444/m.87288 type:complete len:304 (-) Transcript_27444:56-967(-)
MQPAATLRLLRPTYTFSHARTPPAWHRRRCRGCALVVSVRVLSVSSVARLGLLRGRRLLVFHINVVRREPLRDPLGRELLLFSGHCERKLGCATAVEEQQPWDGRLLAVDKRHHGWCAVRGAPRVCHLLASRLVRKLVERLVRARCLDGLAEQAEHERLASARLERGGQVVVRLQLRGRDKGGDLLQRSDDLICLPSAAVILGHPVSEELERRVAAHAKAASEVTVGIGVKFGEWHRFGELLRLGRRLGPLGRELFAVSAPGSVKLDQRERVRGYERVKVLRVEHDDVLLLGKRGGGRTSGEG